MTDRPSRLLEGLGLDLARRMDADCRRFEADWRQERHPRIEDYLGEGSLEGQPALRAELESRELKLRPADETIERTESNRPPMS